MRFFVLLFNLCLLNTQTLSHESVRSAYKEASQDELKAEAFHKSLSEINMVNDATLIAYKGASIALTAKYAKNIKDKKDAFAEGVSLIEYAIEKEPNTIEIRFVRLSIQENAPKLLKYKGNIEGDKQFILGQYNNIKSAHLKEHIKDYILQSKVFTDEEKSVILGS